MAAIMLQGTGSDVGKSVLVAGLCRLFANRGLTVRPFKPQNMSNNAAVAADGGEIGRAQALQALACRVPPSVHMNPVLLKPQSDVGAQVIVHGKVRGTQRAGDYQARKGALLEDVLASYARLRGEADLVIVEGAGSPAEINLRRGDIANMGFARAADVPVVLVGDIDRGGVIAAIVGTRAVIDPEDAAMIRGFLINKFRGDVRLFDDGYREIERRTGWAGLGVVPWLPMARRLPAEDAVVLDHGTASGGAITIAVPMLSRIANFDDFDPLAAEPGIRLVMVPPGSPLPAEAKLVILPGTKATIADLAFFRAQGWDVDLAGHVRRGGRVLGICGGYQMLGESIADPDGIEGRPETVAGLGLLPVETVLTGDKRVTEVAGMSLADGLPFAGYEIHSGRTIHSKPSPQRGEGWVRGSEAEGRASDLGVRKPSPNPLPKGEGFKPLLRLDTGAEDGLTDGQASGCYIHGLFSRPEQRAAWLAAIGAASDGIDQAHRVDAALDELAEALARYVDADQLMKIARTAR